MEEITGENPNYPETALSDEVSNLCEDFLLEKFPCPVLYDCKTHETPIAENGCTLFNHQDADGFFDISNGFTLCQDNDLHSLYSCIDQAQPLVGMMRTPADNKDGNTDALKKIIYGDSGIFPTDNGKENRSFFVEGGEDFRLENACHQYEGAVGSSSHLSIQPRECIQQINHNDIDNAVNPLEETVRDALQEEGIVGSSAENLEISVASLLCSIQTRECIQQKNHNDIDNAVDPLEDTVRDTPLMGSSAENLEVPIASSSLSIQPGECIKQKFFDDIYNAVDPLEDTVRDTQHEGVVGSSAENLEVPIASTSLYIQPGECIKQKNYNDIDNAVGNLEEKVGDHLGVDEEKQDSDGTETEFMIQTHHTEESSCIRVSQFPNIASEGTVDVSTSSPFPEISGAVDDSACRLLVPNNQEMNSHSADQISSNVVDSSTLADTDEYDIIKLDLVIPSTSYDIVLLPPRRSSRPNKFCQKIETGRSSTRRGKIVNKKLPDEIFVNAVRGKRSCPCKRARSYMWGSRVDIIQVKKNEVTYNNGNHLIQIERQRSCKKRVCSGNGRRRKNHPANSLAAIGKGRASNDHTSILLKAKMGGHTGKASLNVMDSDVLDSPATLSTVVGECVTKSDNPVSKENSELLNDIAGKLEDSSYDNKQFTRADGDPGDSVSSPGACFLYSLHAGKDVESTLTQDNSVENSFSNFPQGYSRTGTEAAEEAVLKQYSDPGTSPDSEVVNSIQDVGEHTDPVLTTTQAVPADSATLSMELMIFRKQKKSSKVKGTTDSLVGSFTSVEKSLGQNKKKKSAKHRREEKLGCGCDPTDTSSLGSNENDSRNSSNVETHTKDSTEHENLGELPNVDIINGSSELSGQHLSVKSSELLIPKGMLGSGKDEGLKSSAKFSAGVRKQRPAAPISARNIQKNTCEQRKEDFRKSGYKKRVKEKDSLGQVVNSGEKHQETGVGIHVSSVMTEQQELRCSAELMKDEITGVEILNDPGSSGANNFTLEDLSKSSIFSSGGFDGPLLPTPSAWVCCDDCYKWRSISTELADSIEATHCRWSCSDNKDKAFADCSIPQEKSNAEINAELEISEFSGDEDASCAHPVATGFKDKQFTVPQQAPWKPIEANLFLHRNRKTQSIDEIMICHCKPSVGKGMGCGDECLNRMLNIECVRATCPCGDRCSNQQFQTRKYAKLESFRCGKKGYGLQLLESVSEGDFLIEYVGEVLDLNAYEARQREYAFRGQKHFYFMTLNGSEVIDACVKGNLGRFINHSCDPNCRTEKWMVKGEVCIGLFAMRNIKKGEELTFDYNYVRVFGAAAKKCVCGSFKCRGYIGGDPLNTDTVVQGDSDEEYPEPVMVYGDDESEKVLGRITSNSILSAFSVKQLGSSVEKEENARQSEVAVQPVEISPQKEDRINTFLSGVQPLEKSVKSEIAMKKSSPSMQPLDVSQDNTLSKTLSPDLLLEASSTVTDTMSKFLPDYPTTDRKTISDTVKDRPNISKAHSPAKSSRSSSSIKKGKSRSNPVIASRPQVPVNKLKKVLDGVANSAPKGVEEKLNELLDADGGISKNKDSTKGYLRLLFVTASSGDNVNGEAVQSTRDLSIILDALLKTKKRTVLNDIINKNGLQMLHNIMKQNRKNFSRIPIIRKLLKILEHLAEKEILTLELINSGPPRAGMESFKESIIQLTHHTDIKVHTIARDFRDKWIPRPLKRNSYVDRDDIHMEQQASLHCNRFSAYKRLSNHGSRPISGTDGSSHTPFVGYPVNGTRKRKSRWDQPEERTSNLQSLELMEDKRTKQELVASLQPPEIREAIPEQVDEVNHEIICHDCDENTSKQAENAATVDSVQDMYDDAPPGFASLPLVPYDASSTATSNCSPDIHHSSCSSKVVTGCLQGRYLSHLPVSYGVPVFLVDQLGTLQAEMVDSWEISPAIPFHPFPPLPPYPRENREPQRDCHRASHYQADAGTPCTSGTMSPEVANSGAYNRMRSSSGNLGKAYFRQQKWNSAKYPLPWVRNRTGWGFKANNSRSRAYSLGVDNEIENVCRLDGGGNNMSCGSPQHHHYNH